MKLVLIDGHSIINRAFYGLPDLTNSEGLHTGAVYGFLNIMLRIIGEEKPDHLAVAFDVHAPTFRHEMYKEYKGTRKPMPEELREQVPLLKEMLKAMGIATVEKPGLEADDILGSLAKQAEATGAEVALISGDRDLLQIASDHIKIRIPKTKRGGTEIEDYYAADVVKAYQMDPEHFIQLKALMGDTSDNVPGVPKVGEKTATELMLKYGSIEGIYENLEDISKASIRESLRENRELADLSLKLVTIKTDADTGLSFEDAEYKDPFTDEALKLCRRLEFKAFLKYFENKPATEEKTEYDNTGKILFSEKDCAMAAFICGDRMLTALCDGEGKCRVCLTGREEAAEAVKAFTGKLIVWDVKQIFSAVYAGDKGRELCAGEASACFEDLQLAAYLLNPLKSEPEAEESAAAYLGISAKSYEEAFGKGGISPVMLYSEEAAAFAAARASYLFRMYPILTEKLKEQDMYSLYRDMEMPVAYILYRMEQEGIRADADALRRFGEELKSGIDELEKKIYDAAGEHFNINSPKQLGEILFDKMGVKGGKKTKTGYSTSAEVLEKLADEVPFVRDVLEYRTLTKLKSTYADALGGFIAEDGRIHTKLKQCVTATGRLSSADPNLQNIPMRTELGRSIRKVFTPKEGCIFADADYSQIELRILASMAGDKELIEAYRGGRDIHAITAAKVFHVPFEEVTPLQRRNAKAVNFGIVYGISSFGLSQDLSISRAEAKEYIEEYFRTYPGIKDYLERVKSEAKEKGYSLTLYKRRRPIPELASSNFMQRQFGERVAMNAPIQGTAADVMKLAMIAVYDRMVREGLRSRLILQIHDELLVETCEDEQEAVLAILREEMSGAAELSVALEVDVHTGSDWYEAK
ncbi:MAG: DNA polymerase I [Lachnospiraceae bacterium]|nr:DNA polymerase I [Lachnospiraceae bacterium]